MIHRTMHATSPHSNIYGCSDNWRQGVEFNAACLQTDAPHVLVSVTSPRRLDGLKNDLSAAPFFASATSLVAAPSHAVLHELCRSSHGRRLLQHLHEAADHLGSKRTRLEEDDCTASSHQLDEDLCSAHAAILELDEEIVSSSSDGSAAHKAGSEASRELQRWLQQVQAFVMSTQKDLASSCGEESEAGDGMLEMMHRWRRQAHWARFVAVALPKLVLLRCGAQAALEELHRQELEKARVEQEQKALPKPVAPQPSRIVSSRSRLPYYSHWAKNVAM